jgi:hypothetical protein
VWLNENRGFYKENITFRLIKLSTKTLPFITAGRLGGVNQVVILPARIMTKPFFGKPENVEV